MSGYDYPEPPPNPPACPNCNEELADNPATLPVNDHLDFAHTRMGAYCVGVDGCGWHGTWEEAETFALDMSEARAEAIADGDLYGRGIPLPVPGTVPDADDPPTWEVTITLAVAGCTPREALNEWLACNDPDQIPITSAVIA